MRRRAEAWAWSSFPCPSCTSSYQNGSRSWRVSPSCPRESGSFSGVRLAPKTYLVNGRNHFWRKCKKEAKLFRPLSSNMDRFCKLPQLFSKKDPRSSAPGNCSSFRPLICRRACRQRSAAAQKPGRPAFRCAGGSARRQLRPAFPPAERCSPSGWNKDD